MKWYPLAHLDAITMSCFCAELQALQLLFPNSASGIARALPSFLLYICKFPDSRCRPLMSLPDNVNPFQRCRGGKHKLCTYGAGIAKSRWAGTPSYAKTTDLSGSILYPRPCQKVTERPTAGVMNTVSVFFSGTGEEKTDPDKSLVFAYDGVLGT